MMMRHGAAGGLRALTMGVVVALGALSSAPALGQAHRTQNAPDRSAPVTVEPSRINMGGCMPGSPVVGQAKITNTGDKPLTVQRTQSSCKCTVPKIVETMILPGESISIEATVDVGYDLGMFAKRVSVYFDGYSKPVVFNVVGEVHYGVKSSPTSLKTRSDDESVQFRVETTDGKPFSVLRVGGEEPEYVGFDPAKDPPQKQYTLVYHLPAEPPTWVVVETDHPTGPVVELDMSNPVISERERPYRTSAMRCEETRWNMGVVPQGDTAEFDLEVKGPFVDEDGTGLEGLKMEVFIPEGYPVTLESFEFSPGEEDGKVKVTTVVKPTAKGLVLAPLHFRYAGLETRVWLIGSCRDSVLGQR